MYGAETWAVKKAQEKKLDVAEIRMLRWMCGVTKLDRIRNERIRGTTKVGEISKKVQESRLKWYGHVLREEEYVGKIVMVMPGKRGRERPRRRWFERTRNALWEKELSGEDAQEISTPHKSRKGCGRSCNVDILLYRYVLIDDHLPKNIGTSICFKCRVGIIVHADFLEKMEAFENTNFECICFGTSCVLNE